MGNEVLSSNWSAVVAHASTYALLLFVVPVLTMVALKLWMMAKASAQSQAPKEWILLQEKDAEGIPVLAWNKLEAQEAQARNAALLRAQIQSRR